MFQKILIAEDHDSTNLGLQKTLAELNIPNLKFANNCDSAYLNIKRAILDNAPFDLLITDLSFDPVAEFEKLKSGWELIRQLKDEQISIKIIVFSIENKPMVVAKLFDVYGIDGYVEKSRYDSKDLIKAIEKIATNERYKSPEMEQKLNKEKNNYILDEVDFIMMKMLCKGFNQDEISIELQNKKMVPSSKSSIEKKLKILREEFDAKKNIELAVILQDLGLLKD